ncbi:MAG: methyltransferase domain-containing protein [bacterium]|nr:methyltransferase domain-containing protein [bacterium]
MAGLSNAMCNEKIVNTATDHYQQAIKLIREPIPFEQDIDGYIPEKLAQFDYRDGFAWTFYRGNIPAAISELDHAIAVNPNLVEARILLANLLVTQKKFEPAIEHYQQAMRVAPDNLVLHLNYAVTLSQIGKESEAALIYQSLRTNPKCQFAWLVDMLQLDVKNHRELERLVLKILETKVKLDMPLLRQTFWQKLRAKLYAKVECPLCGASEIVQYYINPKTNRQVFYCVECGLYFVFPQPTETELTKKYTEGYFAPFLANAEKILTVWQEWSATGKVFSPTGKQFSLVFQWLESLGLQEYESQIGCNRKMLDIGCATCGLLAEFINRGWVAEGVEVSPEIIAFNRRMGFKVVQGPLEQLSYSEQSFDFATMTHVIEHLPNPKQTVQEVWRILKPKGKLFIRTPNCDSIPRLIAGKDWFSDQDHLFFFGTRTLTKLLEENGFRILGLKNYVGIDMETYSEVWNELGLNDIIRARINQVNLGDVALVYAEKM